MAYEKEIIKKYLKEKQNQITKDKLETNFDKVIEELAEGISDETYYNGGYYILAEEAVEAIGYHLGREDREKNYLKDERTRAKEQVELERSKK